MKRLLFLSIILLPMLATAQDDIYYTPGPDIPKAPRCSNMLVIERPMSIDSLYNHLLDAGFVIDQTDDRHQVIKAHRDFGSAFLYMQARITNNRLQLTGEVNNSGMMHYTAERLGALSVCTEAWNNMYEFALSLSNDVKAVKR